MVLEWLYHIIIATTTTIQAILTVELEPHLANGLGELRSAGSDVTGRIARLIHVRVGERCQTLLSYGSGLGAGNTSTTSSGLKRSRAVQLIGYLAVSEAIGLNNPHEFLYGVVKRQIDASLGAADSLLFIELHLLNQILVGLLGHTATLVHIEVDIININSGGCRVRGQRVVSERKHMGRYR